MNKEEMMSFLIDDCGFLYKEAKEITDRKDAFFIVHAMLVAYRKGKEKARQDYNYTGGS